MDTVKNLIFSRYMKQYWVADETDATKRISSEQIAHDLSKMEIFSISEITAEMIRYGFKIGFEGSRPVWLMKEAHSKELKEKPEVVK